MTPEKLDYIITATRLRAGAGLHHSNQMVEYLCQEAERLVERVRVLEEEVSDRISDCDRYTKSMSRLIAQVGELEAALRVSQLRTRSAEGIAVMNS